MEKADEYGLTPEEYRSRYHALKEKGQLRRESGAFVGHPRVLAGAVMVDETIPPGWYWTRRLARGLTLRIVNTHGAGSVSVLLWNARDPSERFNAGDTIKVQWTARVGGGRLLLSDMGRVLASVTGDSCGAHDCLAGGSMRALDDAKYGPDSGRRNSRENFAAAAAKHGLSVRDVGPCISFFAPVIVDAVGGLGWKAGAVSPGDYVDLQAETDLLVALSNCPHPLDPMPDWSPKPVQAIVWRAGQQDYCRTASEEAMRAFQNNDSAIAEGGA